MKKLAALCLCLCIMTGSIAWAAEPFSPHLYQLEGQMLQGRAVHLDLSAELKEWVPFETETTMGINNLLKHFSFGIDYEHGEESSRYGLTFLVDQTPVLKTVQKDDQQGTEWYTDLYDAVYTLPKGSNAKGLSFMAQDAPQGVDIWSEVLFGDLGLEALMQHMTQVLTTQGKAAKSTTNLSKVGRAAKTYKITTDGAGAQAIAENAQGVMTNGLVREFAKGLTFSGSKNVFTLYEDKNGTIMGLNFTGYAAHEGGDTRKVSLTWGFKEGEHERLDTLTLKAPSSKGKNKLTLKLVWERSWENAQNTQSLTGTLDVTLDGEKSSQSFDFELTNAKAINGHQITGSLTAQTKQDDDKWVLTLTPSFQTIQEQQGVSFRGSIGVDSQQNKKTLLNGTLFLGLDPDADPIFEPMELMEIIELEGLSPEALVETEKDLAQMMASRFLKALLALPPEDIALLQSGISDANWAQIMQAFEQTAP